MIRAKYLLWCIVFLFITSSLAFGQFPKTGLVLYFMFEGGKDAIIEDDSGNGNDATVNGDPKWVDGKYGKGLQFDGNANYLVVKHKPIFDFTEMTAAAWVNWSGLSAGFRFIICQWGSPGNEWIMRIDSEGRFAAVWLIDNLVTRDTEEKKFPQDEWQHVAVTYKDGEQKLYRNGEVVISSNHKGKLPSGNDDVYIGCNGTKGDKFGGVMDEVAIWNKALTDVQIKMVMDGFNATVQPKDALSISWGLLKSEL